MHRKNVNAKTAKHENISIQKAEEP